VQFVFLIATRQFCGHEANAIQVETVHFIQTVSRQHALLVPGVDLETVQLGHLRISERRKLIRI